MLFKNKGGCSDIPVFREITKEDVFAGAKIMFHGWPYSYRAVKSAFKRSAAAATARSFFAGIIFRRV